MEKNICPLLGNIRNGKHPKMKNMGKLLHRKISHFTVLECTLLCFVRPCLIGCLGNGVVPRIDRAKCSSALPVKIRSSYGLC